jgi:hypothetical protein
MNVGDRVKIRKSPYMAPSLQPGRTGRVVSLDFGNINIVTDDGHEDGAGELDWPFDLSELEVIE